MSETKETLLIIQGQAWAIFTDERCHPIIASKARLIHNLTRKLLGEISEKKDHNAQLGANRE